MQIHSLCRHCLWRGSCAAADGRCDDEGVITDPMAIAGATDYIYIPWCLDPYDPDLLGLTEVDGRWYTELEAYKIRLLEESEDFI